MDSYQPQLPGVSMPTPGGTELSNAANVVITELTSKKLLGPSDSLTVQLILTLASSIDIDLAVTGKVTVALSAAMRLLAEQIDKLPKDAGGEDEFDKLTKAMSAASGAGA